MYKVEQNGSDRDLVFEGWDKGIGPSPHKGIANIQNANVATEDGEVMCSFGRVNNVQTLISSGSISFGTSGTVTYAGSPALTKGAAIRVTSNSISGLSNATYYVASVSGSSIELHSSVNNMFAGVLVSGLGGSGTATISTVAPPGIPVATANQNYYRSGTTYYRYYILADDSRVWFYDTYLESQGYTKWTIIDEAAVSTSTVAGMAVLNGWLFVLSGTTITAKPTVSLSTAWANLALGGMLNANVPHFAYVGHQGRMYWTDGNFLGSLFPNSSLLTGTPNVQSLCSYTASTTTGTPSLINGSLPFAGLDSAGNPLRIPAVFFTAAGGTRPAALAANTIYYISYAQGTGNMQVFAGYTVTSVASTYFGGQNYAANDTITISGGGFTTPCLLTVNSVGPGGNVTAVTVTTGGAYGIKPTNPVVQSATSGRGTGATFTLVFSTPSALNIETSAVGTQYFNTFYPTGGSTAGSGKDTYVWTAQRLNLPQFETATALAEVGNLVIIGAKTNTLYPWNQVDVLPSTLIPLPEGDTKSLLTVNSMVYAFSGNKGNVYVTNGSTASRVFSVPDYCAGIAGTPATYIEPYFTWGGNMYLRGRVYFSILDQNSEHTTGNCGGIWSFVPTEDFFYGQDTGLSLRVENQSSYGTYNGYCPVLIPRDVQAAIGPQYFSGWISSYSAGSGGIDASTTTPVGTTVIETELVPVGTLLNKETFKQIEYKLAAPLAAGETVTIKWRGNGTDAFSSLGTATTESATDIAGYFTPTTDVSTGKSMQGLQWLQLQITLTPLSSSNTSFCRLQQVRVR